MKNVNIMDHALITHKITMIRDKITATKDFRALVMEIATLMTYEVTRDLPLQDVEIETPIKKGVFKKLQDKSLAVIPILRAGLGMVEGVLSLAPNAKVGHIGLMRDEDTKMPKEYYVKLPDDVKERSVIIVDPMLATGGSAVAAVDIMKKQGCNDIKFMAIIASPQGLEKLATVHPDIKIYIGNLDEGLNDKAYIVPGLGDAGDRLFGTLN